MREIILQRRKLTVTAAAKTIGVGRPAFSDFLNGSAATRREMAARIEHAFAIEARDLLDMQASYDAAQPR